MRAILECLVLLCACYGCNKSEVVSIDGELKPRTMKELMEIPGGDWERVDIGRMNLICARDADGTDRIDVERMVKMLDKWAEIAKAAEERYRKSFESHPERYDNSYRISRGEDEEKGIVFKSLSEGEKTVISFLYFVEECKGMKSEQEQMKKKIVVIDDPVSSLSHIYIFNIGTLIKKEFLQSEKFEQVFVLTHSLYFFYELAKQPRRDMEKLKPEEQEKEQKKAYQLYRLVKQ